MAQLLTLLRQTEAYADYHEFVKETFDGMAQAFDDDPNLLAFDTTELVARYPDSTHEQWRTFLNLEVVNRYIKNVIKFESGIAFRKAHKALALAASTGNTTAAKQITEISQILTQEVNNRTVVLTYVQRPRKPVPKPKEEEYVPTAMRPDVEDADLYHEDSEAIEPSNNEDDGSDV